MGLRRFVPIVLFVLALALVACGSRDIVRYIPDEGGEYGADDLQALLMSADLTGVSTVSATDAPESRQQALSELRLHGEDAAALADTLTSDFPTDVSAVPVIVELATYESQPAWIVIEAAADDQGTLGYRRLWVFSLEQRTVLAAQSGR